MISTTLTKLVVKNLKLSKNSNEFKCAIAACLRHLLWDLSHAEFHKEIAKHVEFKDLELTPKTFRLKLRDNGYCHSSIKFFVLALLKTNRKLNLTRIKRRFRRYDVAQEDAKAIAQTLIGNMDLIRILSSTKRFKETLPSMVTSNQYKESLAKLSTYMEPLTKHCKAQSSHRLQFITKYNSMQRDEYASDLMIHAISAYYRDLPNVHEKAYVLNYMRRAASNRLVNIIEEQTRECRQRLVNEGSDNGDGAHYILKTSNESQLFVTTDEGEMEVDYSAYASLEYSSDVSRSREFNLSADQLYNQAKPKSKRQCIYGILTKYSRGFEEWLERKKYLRSVKTSHDFLVEKPLDTVITAVAEFTDATECQVRQCIEELSSHLVQDQECVNV